MPKCHPGWAYGKYRIVPHHTRIGQWSVQEKGWFFFKNWRRELGEGFYDDVSFDTIDEAKKAIDHAIYYVEKSIVDNMTLKEWRKKKPIDYP